MPKEKEMTNHPCHLLSLPSAKRFWCRHCMSVFEDAITRWRHSRSCRRYGVSNNFMRRRELEARALQNTTALNSVDARLEQSIQMCDLASLNAPREPEENNQPQLLPGSSVNLSCLICHQKFTSMEEMRTHVKYPCSNSKIITTHVAHPKHSVPVFIDAVPGQAFQWQTSLQQTMAQSGAYMQAESSDQETTEVRYDIEIEQDQEMEVHIDASAEEAHNSNGADSITPTNIYVNEQGETVIEVENLDLNAEGAELSLAHLLTQLSQKGIVFEKGLCLTRSKSSKMTDPEFVIEEHTAASTSYAENTQESSIQVKVEDEEQPTAEDAANTLAQLAGLRSFNRASHTELALDKSVEHSHFQNSGGNVTASSAEHSRGYSAGVDPSLEVHYQYQYPDSSAVAGQHDGNHDQFPSGSRQSQFEQMNVKIEDAVVEDAIYYYKDNSGITYLVDSNSQHQLIETELSTISSSDNSNNGYPVLTASQSLLTSQIPNNEEGPNQEASTSNHLTTQQFTESLSGKQSGFDSSSSLVMVSENGSTEDGRDNMSSISINKVVEDHDGESKADTENCRSGCDTEEVFTIETVCLQEIVDS